jgi:5-methyltetrahydrofolate--homocysteine methyltransferase
MKGPVLHVLDASRAVGVASSLVSDTQKEPLVDKTAADYARCASPRQQGAERAGRRSPKRAPTPLPTIRPARRRRRRGPACTISANGPLRELRAAIDWTPFFRAWELAGNYPAILDDAVVGESARSLFADAQAMLDRMIAEHWVTPRGTVGLWRCKRAMESGGDDVLVLAGNDWTRLPFLRQQVKKREGRPNMCLADYIDPAGRGLDRRLRGRHSRARAASGALQGGA